MGWEVQVNLQGVSAAQPIAELPLGYFPVDIDASDDANPGVDGKARIRLTVAEGRHAGASFPKTLVFSDESRPFLKALLFSIGARGETLEKGAFTLKSSMIDKKRAYIYYTPATHDGTDKGKYPDVQFTTKAGYETGLKVMAAAAKVAPATGGNGATAARPATEAPAGFVPQTAQPAAAAPTGPDAIDAALFG